MKLVLTATTVGLIGSGSNPASAALFRSHMTALQDCKIITIRGTLKKKDDLLKLILLNFGCFGKLLESFTSLNSLQMVFIFRNLNARHLCYCVHTCSL